MSVAVSDDFAVRHIFLSIPVKQINVYLFSRKALYNSKPASLKQGRLMTALCWHGAYFAERYSLGVHP